MTSNPASVGPAPDGLRREVTDRIAGTISRAVNAFAAGAGIAVRTTPDDCFYTAEAVVMQADDLWLAPHPDREAEPTGGVELVCRVGWEEARRLSLADGEEDNGPWPPVAGAFGWQEDDSEAVRETERAKAKAVLQALSVSPPVVEGSLRASPCVPTEQTADLCSRLDAIVTEEDQFHPVGCSTWWEEARVAVDMAKDFICRHQAQPTEGHEAAVVGWRPIEEHDGSPDPVLVFSPDASEPGVVIGTWLEFDGDPDPGSWADFWTLKSIDAGLTHFMPLPETPDA